MSSGSKYEWSSLVPDTVILDQFEDLSLGHHSVEDV